MHSNLGATNRLIIALGTLACVFFIFSSHGSAEFYKYVDKEGKVYYVDDLGKVPSEYLDQIQVYKDKYDYLPENQRSATRLQDRNAEVEIELQHRQKLEQQLDLADEQEQAEAIRRAQEELEEALETPVAIEGNRVLVPVTLGNKGSELETLLLLDTGASQMVVHRDIADQLSIVAQKKGLSQVAGGQTIQTEMGQLSYLKVGPIKMHDPYVIIINHSGPAVNYKGLLGMNFLRNVQYTIDFEKQVIKWAPPKKQKDQ